MRSVFNEAQSDDTLRQVGGVFYTDSYIALSSLPICFGRLPLMIHPRTQNRTIPSYLSLKFSFNEQDMRALHG